MPKQLPDPKDYEYKLPEGYSMDATLRAKLDELVKKTCLSNEEAQEYVNLHVELMEDYAARLEIASANKEAAYGPELSTL